MPRSGEQGLFAALEHELRNSNRPLDCNELFERPGVREHAASVNRVSDYLGGLWRKGKVVRLPAPKGDNSTRSRWMYEWKRTNKPASAEAIPYIGRGVNLYDKPGLVITEEGRTVVLDLPQLTITIRQK